MTTRASLRDKGKAMRRRLFGDDDGASALNMGLSRTEVIEAIIQTAPLSGFAPALNALGGLSEALGGNR